MDLKVRIQEVLERLRKEPTVRAAVEIKEFAATPRHYRMD